ncbi:MAG: manganese efflux pump MntP family protein [Firmicutes bacterium]|nr:manganese efflux pump MntP family protein [Bacillota bacterium]
MDFSLIYIFTIAVILGIDAFSVALSVGVFSCLPAQVFRISASFGFFQFFMPIIGYYLGSRIVGYIRDFDHWIAFGILFAIGVKMLVEAFAKEEEEKIKCDRTIGWTLIGLSIATSIDALAVGITLGIMGTKIFVPCVIIGIVAGLMTMTGMLIGNKCSQVFGKRMEAVGAIVLILLSFKMLSI